MSTDSGVIRANHNSKFYARFLMLGAAAFAVMGWFLYDGLYAWPREHQRYELYTELTQGNRGSEWEDEATARGWSVEPPEKDYSQADIQLQYACAVLCALVGCYLLAIVLMARGRWISSDGSRITTSWGETIEYDSVIEIDKKKWMNKGIAYIKYRDGAATKQFVLDDFKFIREPTDEILAELEEKVGVEKIVNGAPEAEQDSADPESPSAETASNDTQEESPAT